MVGLGTVRGRVKVGLGLGVGVGLVASLLLIAGCRFTVPRDRGPVTSSGYMTLLLLLHFSGEFKGAVEAAACFLYWPQYIARSRQHSKT